MKQTGGGEEHGRHFHCTKSYPPPFLPLLSSSSLALRFSHLSFPQCIQCSSSPRRLILRLLTLQKKCKFYQVFKEPGWGHGSVTLNVWSVNRALGTVQHSSPTGFRMTECLEKSGHCGSPVFHSRPTPRRLDSGRYQRVSAK